MPGELPPTHRRLQRSSAALLLAALVAATAPALAADPERGAQLFFNSPRPGLLACADCHSDNPQLNNFGNIWTGRNAPSLIERAVRINTGGMAVFQGLYNLPELTDIAAFLGNAPRRLEFPLTALGATSAMQTIEIATSTKTGISGVSLRAEGDFVIAGSSCGNSVDRFSSCSVDVAFRPTALGLRSGALLLSHSDTATPVRLALSGQGPQRPPPRASLSPAALGFGSVAVGQGSATKLTWLRNDGESPLQLGALAIDSADFVHAGGSCAAGLALAPAQACTVSLRFVPAASGTKAATLTMRHDGAGSASALALTGAARVGPEARLDSDAVLLDFGTLAAGRGAAPQRLTVRNSGNASMRLQSVQTTAPAFAIERNECTAGLLLAPGQACRVEVAFRPDRTALFSASLLVQSDAAAALLVPLGGSVVVSDTAAAFAAPALALSAAVGRTATAQAVLIHRGAQGLRLGTLSISGPEAADFRIVAGGTCDVGKELRAGSHCTVSLNFTPVAAGQRSARLQAQFDAQPRPVVLDLAGQAAQAPRAELWLDAVQLDFGEATLAGAPVPARRVTVHNRGAAALGWQQIAVIGAQAGDFDRAGTCSTAAALAPGASCDVQVRFTPSTAGQRSASLALWPLGSSAPNLVSLGAVVVLQLAPPLPPWPAASATPLTWLTPPDAPSHGSTTVGAVTSGAIWEVVNSATQASGPLHWSVGGPDNGDFSVDASGSCSIGQALAPGARCTLRLAFHPQAAGPRQALLTMGDGDATAAALQQTLQGTGIAAATPSATLQPGAVAFNAFASGAASPVQRLWLSNPTALPIQLRRLLPQAVGIQVVANSFADACGTEVALDPGQRCSIDLQWDRSPALAAGATLVIAGDATAAAVLSVTEDPAQTSNVGTGGGSFGGPFWLGALLLAVLALRRSAATESRHV